MKSKILCAIIVFLCLFLLARFSKTSTVYENLSDTTVLSDAPLRLYLSSSDKYKDKQCPYPFKKFIGGHKLGIGCTVPPIDGTGKSDGPTQWGTTWQASYKNEDPCDVCVPKEYESKNAYIPCSATKPGPPNIKGCGFPDSDCQAAIDAIKPDFPAYHKYRKVETKADIQQYLFKCGKKNSSGKRVCPCMDKWGRNHKPYDCNAPLKSYNCETKDDKKMCIPVEGGSGQYKTPDECTAACNPVYPNGYDCEATKSGPLCVKKTTGKYPNEETCNQNCGPPYKNGYDCEATKSGPVCVLKTSGKYPTEEACNIKCGPPYKNGYDCEATMDKQMCVPVSEGKYPDEGACKKVCGKEPIPLTNGDGPVNLTPCIKFKGKNVTTLENRNYFDKQCTKFLKFPSKSLRTMSSDCPQPGYARGVCSLTSPVKVKKIR